MGTQVELKPGADQPRLHGMVQQARGDQQPIPDPEELNVLQCFMFEPGSGFKPHGKHLSTNIQTDGLVLRECFIARGSISQMRCLHKASEVVSRSHVIFRGKADTLSSVSLYLSLSQQFQNQYLAVIILLFVRTFHALIGSHVSYLAIETAV